MTHPSDVEIPAIVFLVATLAILLSRGGRSSLWRYLIPHRHLLSRRADRWICLRCPRTWKRTDLPPRRMGRI